MAWNLIVLTILTIVVHQQLTARRSDLLDLKQKRLTSVPEHTGKNTGQISTISLFRNLITDVQDSAFSAYTGLKVLNLSRNKLIYVSSSAFNQTLITNLLLLCNQLSCIPDLSVIHNTLENIHLHGNKLSTCDKQFVYEVNFTKLSTIFLGGNGLTHLFAMTLLWFAPKLNYVNLENNRLEQVENFLLLLPKLKTFNLGKNLVSCSCEIRWLKNVKETGLRMKCLNFGTLSGKMWSSLTHEDLSIQCQLSPTYIEPDFRTCFSLFPLLFNFAKHPARVFQ